MHFPKPAKYHVKVTVATVHANAQAAVECASQVLRSALPQTGDWATFTNADFGQLEIHQAGTQILKLRANEPSSWKAINARSVTLTRIPENTAQN